MIVERSSRLPAFLSRVLVFRALNLGDMLCAVPALRALRAGLPHVRITLCGLPWARSFSVRFGRYLDDFIEFPGYPGLPEQQCETGRLRSFLKNVRLSRYDLAIQMHGSGLVSNALVASFGAHGVAGFYPQGQSSPDGEFFLPYPEALPEIDRNLALVEHLGFPLRGRELEFPITEEDQREVSIFPQLNSLLPGGYVCIHPGASVREKCWSVEHFGAVARELLSAGLAIVVTGNRKESDLASRIADIVKGECVDAASLDLSLGGLALLIRDARLLLCNDTGVSHLAAALRVPSVVVFSTADPDRWAPANRELHRSLGGKGSVPSVDEVLKAVHEVILSDRTSRNQRH